MRQIIYGIIYGFSIIVIVVLVFSYQHQNRQNNVASDIVASSTQNFSNDWQATSSTPAVIPFDQSQFDLVKTTMQQPYVLVVRTALNDYLAGLTESASLEATAVDRVALGGTNNLICGLKVYDSSYYKNKFTLLSIENGIMGGKWMIIAFPVKPNLAFKVWTYNTGTTEKPQWQLRLFCNWTASAQDVIDFLTAYKEYIQHPGLLL